MTQIQTALAADITLHSLEQATAESPRASDTAAAVNSLFMFTSGCLLVPVAPGCPPLSRWRGR